MLHQLAVIAHTQNPEVIVGDQLPFNSDAEFMDVWLGVLPDRSLRMPGGKQLSKAIVGHFTEIYPDATLSPCGTELRKGGTVFRLLDVLGLTEHSHPPLTMQALSATAAAALVRRAPTSHESPFLGEAGPSTRAPLSRPQQMAVEEVVCQEIEGVQAGIDLVVHYLDQDVNSLPPAEREIYIYGFPGARVYIDRLSPKKKKDLFKYLPVGTYRGVEVVTRIATALRLVIRAELTDEQWALMAGARVLIQKGGWDIQVDGEWTRRLGPI